MCVYDICRFEYFTRQLTMKKVFFFCGYQTVWKTLPKLYSIRPTSTNNSDSENISLAQYETTYKYYPSLINKFSTIKKKMLEE